MYTLDRTTGTPIWLYDTRADGLAAQFHGEPVIAGERLVIPTDADPEGHIYSFDADSGDLLWKKRMDRGVATTPLLIDGRIVAVSAVGEVVALDVTSGKAVWTEKPVGVLKPIPFVQAPAHSGKRLFVTDNTNQMLALDSVTGATLWTTRLDARANTSAVVVGNKVVVGTDDGHLNWIEARSGRLEKRIRLDEGRPYGTLILAPPLLFVLTADAKGSIIALDAKSGSVRWKQETAKEWTTYRPLIAGSNVIVGSEAKVLCAFDRGTGAMQWCRPISQVPRGLGISADGWLYVGSLSGVVQAYRLDAAETP